MQSLNEDEIRAVFGEVIADNIKLILEYVKDIPAMKSDIREMKQDNANFKSRIYVLEQVAKDHEIDIKMLKTTLA